MFADIGRHAGIALGVAGRLMLVTGQELVDVGRNGRATTPPSFTRHVYGHIVILFALFTRTAR